MAVSYTHLSMTTLKNTLHDSNNGLDYTLVKMCIRDRLARLSDCERQYQAALSEKIKSIKASAHPLSLIHI